MLCFLVDCLLSELGWSSISTRTTGSQLKSTVIPVVVYISIPPDDGLQISPKHGEGD